MTDCHRHPVEQTELISNERKVPNSLVYKSKQPSINIDNSHYGISETESVTVNMEDLFLKDFLPENGPLVIKLSQLLNRRNSRVIYNWEHLAHALDVPSDVSMSFDCDSEHSPTDDLFDHLTIWKPEMTFAQLKSILRSAGRNDLIQILEKEDYDNSWKISDNDDFVEKFKDKLDTPRRYMDWKALASKCGIPKKVFNQFGKPKLGPMKQLVLHVRISASFNGLTIDKLKGYFKDMDRYDVLKVFERHNVKDNALVRNELKPEAPIMYELSDLLDKDGPFKNWRNLAYKMGIPEHIYEGFDSSRVHNRNPTKLLLDWIFAGDPHFTVGKFIKCLQDINRNDVVIELQKGILQATKGQKQNHILEATQKSDHPLNKSSQGYTSNLTRDTKLSQNWDHLSQQQRVELQVTLLPQPLYTKICQMLDALEPFFRDYRMFAESLGVEKTKIDLYQGQKGSPTHDILLQYRINVETFLGIMNKIEREDIIAEVERWLDGSSSG